MLDLRAVLHRLSECGDIQPLDPETTAYHQMMTLGERLFVQAILDSPPEAAIHEIVASEIVCLTALASWGSRKLLCQTTDFRPRAYASAIKRLESRRILAERGKASLEYPRPGTFDEFLSQIPYMNAAASIKDKIDTYKEAIDSLTTDDSLIDPFIDEFIQIWEERLQAVYKVREKVQEKGINMWWMERRMEVQRFIARHNHEMYRQAEEEEQRHRGGHSSVSHHSERAFDQELVQIALDLIVAEQKQAQDQINERYSISS